jgi:uncharacterized protein (DUF488 family)
MLIPQRLLKNKRISCATRGYDDLVGKPARYSAKKFEVFTIGHSTRPIEEFVELLNAHGVKRVIDVRTIPRSRHNPQFNRESLKASLQAAKIGYTNIKKLGGLRHPKPDSINLGWRNSGFRGFADYMQTPEFEAALERAIKLAKTKPSVLMCAEAVPWRCHRSLIADALAVRKIPVKHIVSASRAQAHKITPFALVRGSRITYPDETIRRAR